MELREDIIHSIEDLTKQLEQASAIIDSCIDLTTSSEEDSTLRLQTLLLLTLDVLKQSQANTEALAELC